MNLTLKPVETIKVRSRIKIALGLAGLAVLALTAPAHAGTFSSSTTAPTIDATDIANLGTATGTDKWFFQSGNEANPADAAKGQTFTTGSEALRLKALTFKAGTGSKKAANTTYTTRVGTILGTTFTQIASETCTQTVDTATDAYMTWRFANPVLLLPDTTYGIDVAMKSAVAWQTGIPYLAYSANDYSSGVYYDSGDVGVGGATIATTATRDRVFHVDLEKPIGPGWNLVATSPADEDANAPTDSSLTATFSQNIGLGTGNLTLRNLSDAINTVIPVGDSRVSVSANLLTINPGHALLPLKSYAIRIDPTAITNVLGASYPGITNDTTWNFTTGPGDPLVIALLDLKSHITGATNLSAAQINAHKLTIDAESYRFAESATIIAATFDLVRTYDTVKGPLWVSRSLPQRDSVTNDLHWTLYTVMQDIMDVTYKTQTLTNHEALLNGFKFNSASNFPGPCVPPANSNQTYTATLSASYLDTRGWPSQGDGPGTFARKPTGCYLAPGSIATITVPPALVGKGYKIRVGAHSWDFSNKPSIKRLDRSSLLFSISALETKVASPLGGGIYIEVPFLASNGVVNVQLKNAVRSPYFSAKSFHTTTPTQWLTERTNAAPWADFQSDKFMMQVPSSWISAMPDPAQLIRDWDASMDAINDLMGFPRLRGKETLYPQVDLQIRASVFAPGYPSVNVGGFSATATYGGYNTHYLVRGPQYGDDANIDFHEQGHAYFFDKFPGETESNVNLLYVPVLQVKFGLSLDAAFRASLGYNNSYQTLDTTAMAWMTVFNFSPREVPMADAEKAYQLKGHAKFVDIARLYGWGVLSNYWSSFVTDYEAGSNYATATDSLLLRLSKSVGKDIRPLFHFWGIHPQNPATLTAAMTNAHLLAPVEIFDTLVHYQSLVPPNNTAFTNFAYKWWGHKPSMSGYWEEREHARQWDTNALYSAGDQQRSQLTNPGEIYNQNSAADITNRVQELINLYYPNGRPTDYGTWAAHWPGANLTNPNADYDGDGQSNDNERIWGLNPTNALSRNSFTSLSGLATGHFSYTRRTPSFTGYSYTVWTSTNLVTWAQDTGAVQVPGTPVAEVETVVVTVSPALLTRPQLFIRMRAAP